MKDNATPVIVWGRYAGNAWKARDVRAAAKRSVVRVFNCNVATPAMAVSVLRATVAHANENAVVATRARKPERVQSLCIIVLKCVPSNSSLKFTHIDRS